MAIHGTRGISPIGGVVAWLKSFTNMPTLATQGRDEWVECNGDTISDTESPLDGQTLPDLGPGGGTQRFLRGAAISGTTGGVSTHRHSISIDAVNVGCGSINVSCVTSPTGYSSSLPMYYEVVWIVRIK